MPSAPRIALRLAYLGGGFAGWQRQPRRRTVQGELELALARLYRAPVQVRGAGRTDAGVHATGQVAHFDPPFPIPPAGVREALNGILPADLRVRRAWPAGSGFDAHRSARAKRYRYRLAWGEVLDPWEALRSWEVPWPLALEDMRGALEAVVGTHDFAAFALSGHAGTGRRGTVRTVLSARLAGRGRRLALVIEGDGFLRGMIRRIAGALVEVGRGARPAAWFHLLVCESATRPPAPTAPARGLTLERVIYS
ncbi:MAG: tRNA pseudouridine(38-40) synthase TruA [Acidobacteriota bacterium]